MNSFTISQFLFVSSLQVFAASILIGKVWAKRHKQSNAD